MADSFDMDVAQQLLEQANNHFAGMVPAVNGQPRQPAVAEHAKRYVEAIGGLQQQLLAFAVNVPQTPQARLQQEVSALQQELTRADTLLQETSALVQQWQRRCQDLRGKHAAVLTKEIGARQQLPQQAEAMQ